MSRYLSLFLSMVLCSWLVVSAHNSRTTTSVSERKISIDFRINSWEIDSAYSTNASNLRDLHKLLAEARINPSVTLDSIKVSGHASPDGSLPKNRELSLRRAIALRQYLSDNCGVPDSVMQFGENIVPWDMFRSIIADSDYPWRHEALRIMASGSDNDAADNTRRMNRLKRLSGGDAWRVMARDILPQLRSAFIVTAVITVSSPGPQPEPVIVDDAVSRADTVADCCRPAVVAPVVRRRDHDRFDIKTNGAYLAAGVANIGAEMAVGDHWSIDVPLVYSPYTIARNYRLRFLYIQPEARYWLDRPLRGHFFGIHAHAGVANVSVNSDTRYQTPDGFYGGGISYGYSLPVARRWSVEFTVGAGYFHTRYDSYHNIGIPQGQRFESGTPLNYWGIDKLGINIVYRFGDKSYRRKEVVVQ